MIGTCPRPRLWQSQVREFRPTLGVRPGGPAAGRKSALEAPRVRDEAKRPRLGFVCFAGETCWIRALLYAGGARSSILRTSPIGGNLIVSNT